jgi:hypothetical protein
MIRGALPPAADTPGTRCCAGPRIDVIHETCKECSHEENIVRDANEIAFAIADAKGQG